MAGELDPPGQRALGRALRPQSNSPKEAFSKEDVANIKWFANIPPGLEDLEGKVLERIKAAQ